MPAPVSRGGDARTRVDGSSFPDHVVSLTWDDGPDLHTLELAKWLSAHHVSGTFFVVAEWQPQSEEPGRGAARFATGYVKIPILDDLVALGHRVGNHTAHHALLAGSTVGSDLVRAELGDNQRALDAFQTNAFHPFRAPGGYFDEAAKKAMAGTKLDELVGPIHWDVDGKDWEGSLFCGEPKSDCELRNGQSRVRPEAMAARYLARITSAGYGIVLLHDRVGDVGSTYALDIARVLIPRLESSGFVFAAPVLRFSPLPAVAPHDARRVEIIASREVIEGDLNGDGRPDSCARSGPDLTCSLALPSSGFAAPSIWLEDVPPGPLALRDVNADGRADLCVPDGRCAMAP